MSIAEPIERVDHATAQDARAANIFERAVCLSIEIGKPGRTRKGDLDAVTTDADKDALKLSKTLFDGPEWSAIVSVDTAISNYLNPSNGVCLKSKILRGGMHLVPFDLVEKVDAKLDELCAERAVRVETFLDAYERLVEEARERLKSQFDIADYPRKDALRQKFYVEREYVTLGVPGKLKAVSAQIFARERAQAEAKWREGAEEIQAALREAMADLVAAMADRLAPKPDGSKKVITAAGVEKLTNFLDTFAARNITDDAELDTLVQQAREIMAGKSVDELRSNDGLRAEVGKQFAELKESVGTLMRTAPRRRINLDDDE